ncbi:hypothetical protein NQZ68_041616, partial [Dissostichus eleginoides]
MIGSKKSTGLLKSVVLTTDDSSDEHSQCAPFINACHITGSHSAERVHEGQGDQLFVSLFSTWQRLTQREEPLNRF